MIHIHTRLIRIVTLLGIVLSCFMVTPYVGADEALPGKIVDGAWLEQNLARDDVRIIDVRDDIKQFWTNHIPGAVFVHPEALRWPDSGIPGKSLSPGVVATLLGTLAINPETTIIVYSKGNDFYSTYLLWQLDYIGHASSAMLDGGYAKWEKEKRPLTQDYKTLETVEYAVPSRVNEKIRVTHDELKTMMGSGDVVLLDVRPETLYTGTKGFWKRNGHIKGALSLPWTESLTPDGSWKSRAALETMFNELGVTRNKTVIVYCGQGQMSAHSYIALHHILGYPNVANYDGGFHEWSSKDTNPVGTGKATVQKPKPSPTAKPLDGKALVQQRCVECHSDSRIYRKTRDRAYWEKTVDRMIKKGTRLTAAERAAIIAHLTSP